MWPRSRAFHDRSRRFHQTDSRHARSGRFSFPLCLLPRHRTDSPPERCAKVFSLPLELSRQDLTLTTPHPRQVDSLPDGGAPSIPAKSNGRPRRLLEGLTCVTRDGLD